MIKGREGRKGRKEGGKIIDGEKKERKEEQEGK